MKRLGGDTGSDLLWKKLETRIGEIADRLDGVMGVAILDLTDGRTLFLNGDRVFPAASSIKLVIYQGKALNKELADELIKQLKTLKKDSYLSCELPAGVDLADKPGSLDDVRNDSDIVFAQNQPFAISVMTAYDRDEKAAERAISEVALEAYHYFEMHGKTSEYGRVLPPENRRK